ncbi:MAG: hypothetical protein HC838_00020 [Spirulinaceae cyanobacterium RM2_2_10]|nr:hypothetical protein [Spirulinaceae cyanobacterium RM2_2_10]
MSANNARIIEKNIFGLLATQGGDSEIIDLFGIAGGSSKFSLQAVYDVQAPTAKTFDADEVDVANDSVSVPNHGYTTGFKVQLTSTGTLPGGLATSTDYFLIVVDANTLKFATSLANAIAGTAINITNQGSGGAVNTITGVALAGASVTFRKSNDGVNWIDIQAATAITVDGSVMIEQPNVSYRYVKAVKALTSGQVDLKGLICVLGDAA